MAPLSADALRPGWRCPVCCWHNRDCDALCCACGRSFPSTASGLLTSKVGDLFVENIRIREASTYIRKANSYIEKVGNPAIHDRRLQFARNTPGSRAGFVQEEWHVQSFNKNAIAGNSAIRAVMSEHGSPSDAYLIDLTTNRIVKKVQFKRYKTAEQTQKQLQKPQYADMEKVGPKDHAGKGVDDAVHYDGVASDPLSKRELDDLSETGGGMKDLDIVQQHSICAKVLNETFAAAALGGAIGCGVAALYSCARWARGEINNKECARAIMKGACTGAGAGAVCKLAQTGLDCVKKGAGRAVPIAGAVVGALLGARSIAAAAARAEHRQAVAASVEAAASVVGTCAGLVLGRAWPVGWAALAVGVLGGWGIRELA